MAQTVVELALFLEREKFLLGQCLLFPLLSLLHAFLVLLLILKLCLALGFASFLEFFRVLLLPITKFFLPLFDK